MAAPLLELRQLRREFPAGDQTIAALKSLDLTIEAGEMVAIIGQSGSGKSTLMNVLGCLDRPTSGSYRVAGRDTATLAPDELAQLRREHFGFVFQRYHLIGDLDAVGNVEVPAIYAGRNRLQRRERAGALLGRLGLGHRLHHRPNQLSGGQQQRVSIARALMNGGQVILADEPTGALDRESGAEMLAILETLHHEGHTIIIVTHDPQVAAHAGRIIELSDGELVADRINGSSGEAARPPRPVPAVKLGARSLRAYADQLVETLRMTLVTMAAHRLRTFLTMLGIIIGIASVASVVALGEGTRRQILNNISGLGASTISVHPGKGFGDPRAWSVRTLTARDADALAQQSYIEGVTPSVWASPTLRYRNITSNASAQGIGEQSFRVLGLKTLRGTTFSAADISARSQSVVIDEITRKALFTDQQDPIGEVILINTLPCRVIGVVKPANSSFGSNQTLTVYLPYTTVLTRLLGQSHLGSISVRIRDDAPVGMAQAAIEKLLRKRHGRQDFFLFNEDAILKSIQSTTLAMSLLISSIAAITLLVGGIGVMNIMLVSVIERTREIGIRTAVGARRSDIMAQFLIEAVMICLIGGVLGVLLALGIGALFSNPDAQYRMVFSPSAIAIAFASSTLVGMVFGFLPARNAARLDPVDSLARE
ncbi:MacB family efflux pump subunit [Hydrocarboniphaga sp.]|uniref:MacB family efflux pump subunit n=1 Tax=Hydrocarboniphaga sp. TaxID=2033016 RepID=UPI003D1147F6